MLQHFIFFVQEFKLVEPKELAPLSELIDSLTAEKPYVPCHSFTRAHLV